MSCAHNTPGVVLPGDFTDGRDAFVRVAGTQGIHTIPAMVRYAMSAENAVSLIQRIAIFKAAIVNRNLRRKIRICSTSKTRVIKCLN